MKPVPFYLLSGLVLIAPHLTESFAKGASVTCLIVAAACLAIEWYLGR